MAAVGDAPPRRPTELAQRVEEAQILHEAVAQSGVDLDPIPVGPQAAVAEQVAAVLRGEEVLAGCERPVVLLREPGLQLVVQRIAGLLEPEEAVRCECRRVGQRRFPVEPAVGVDREPAIRRRPRRDAASMRARSSASGAPPIFIFTTV